jgi:hypothetical protein
MSSDQQQVTVSELMRMIEAHEEMRAELRLLAIRAYEHWLELEAKLEQLEHRLELSRLSSALVAGRRLGDEGEGARCFAK